MQRPYNKIKRSAEVAFMTRKRDKYDDAGSAGMADSIWRACMALFLIACYLVNGVAHTHAAPQPSAVGVNLQDALATPDKPGKATAEHQLQHCGCQSTLLPSKGGSCAFRLRAASVIYPFDIGSSCRAARVLSLDPPPRA